MLDKDLLSLLFKYAALSLHVRKKGKEFLSDCGNGSNYQDQELGQGGKKWRERIGSD